MKMGLIILVIFIYFHLRYKIIGILNFMLIFYRYFYYYLFYFDFYNILNDILADVRNIEIRVFMY